MKDSVIEEVQVNSVDVGEVLEAVRVWVEEAYRAQQFVDEAILPNNIVIRLDVRFNWSAVEHELLGSLCELREIIRERFKTPNLYVLYSSNFEIRMFLVCEAGAELKIENEIPPLRSRELSALAVNSNALYHQFGNHYYRLPSGA